MSFEFLQYNALSGASGLVHREYLAEGTYGNLTSGAPEGAEKDALSR